MFELNKEMTRNWRQVFHAVLFFLALPGLAFLLIALGTGQMAPWVMGDLAGIKPGCSVHFLGL